MNFCVSYLVLESGRSVDGQKRTQAGVDQKCLFPPKYVSYEAYVGNARAAESHKMKTSTACSNAGHSMLFRRGRTTF